MKLIFIILLFVILYMPSSALAELGNSVKENQKQFGREVSSKQFSDDDDRNFSGKKVYHFPLYGWQLETLYIDGDSVSETARPKGSIFKKEMLTERESNVIADMLYPKRDRGRYRKQVKNANFISHFFEDGVISYEMKLDKRRKHHIGIIGVRALLYTDGAKFNEIMINAYH